MGDEVDPAPTTEDTGLVALLDHIRRARNFDISGYKRPTLERRLQKRIQALRLESYSEYLDHLQVHPDEFTALFDTLLINVTGFFRDADAWRHLQEEIVPELLGKKPADEQLRIWSAGCSSGQEAYTTAIVVAEVLGHEAFLRRVKIYGTDVDDDALAQARHGVYQKSDLDDVPADLRDQYFEAANNGALGDGQRDRVQFRTDLRRNVIFGRHDLVQDAPISRLDLLICRNTLMYFNSDVQAHILDRFHFALQPNGVLFLGKAEKLLRPSGMFEPADAKRRFFRKLATDQPRHRMLHRTVEDTPVPPQAVSVELRDQAFDAGPSATVAVDAQGHLVLANAAARRLFRLAPQDLGRPLKDLEISYRPVELRAAIERARDNGQAVELPGVRWQASPTDARILDVRVVPLRAGDTMLGAAVSFLDVSEIDRLGIQAANSRAELAEAQEELQATTEELETTNEELQSTVEELETTNEELQSTNEELETMNEELQSTNDELQVANQELYQHQMEIKGVNQFLAAILRSLRRAVVVVDENLVVKVWNDHAEDLWGLRSDEVVGTHFLHLDVGFPVHELRDPLLASATTGAEPDPLMVTTRNRRGMPIDCFVSITPLEETDAGTTGAIVLMEERRRSESSG